MQLAHDLGPDVTASRSLRHYTVEFADDTISRIKRRRAIERILAMPAFKNITKATDFSKFIITTEKLDDSVLVPEGHSLSVVLPPSGSTTVLGAPDDNAPQHIREARQRNTITFRIVLGGCYSIRDLISYINSASPDAHYGGYGTVVQMLNIIMCKAPNEAKSVAKLPGNKFYPHQGLLGVNNHPDIDYQDLAGGLVALRGYYSSVRCATGRILLNLNVTSGAFYQTVSLQDLLAKFGNPDLFQREIFIRKLKVLYSRPGKNPIKSEKTIIGFAKTPDAKKGKPPKFTVKRFGNANEVRFTYGDANGSHETTVTKYFKDHGVTLTSPELPVLNVGSVGDPKYIPMEMCTVLPGQPYRKFLSGQQTSDMLKFAARYPNQNAMSIAGDATTVGTGLKLLQLRGPQGSNPQSQSIELFGLNVSTSMLTVEGRILPAPQVKYGKKTVRPSNGSWNCADQSFIKGGRFESWATMVLNLPGRATLGRSADENDHHIGALRNELKKYGLQMGDYKGTRSRDLQHLTFDNRDVNNSALDSIFSVAGNNRIPLIFVVLPNDDKWLYARIKYYGDAVYGIHTICSIGSKLSNERGQGMYMGNLALKFNLKGGGVNHEIANTLIRPLDKSTMLMGIDVTHPSPGSAKGAPSIACAVASRDPFLSQWPGSLRKQTGKQEMIDEKRGQFSDCVDSSNLQDMVIERLECWRKFNDGLPKKILVYRDGVSEGQYALVLSQELPHFNAAFKKLYGSTDKWPRMAVIVVGKRHHTRFYATSPNDADYNQRMDKGSRNTKPGTVVDRGITGKTYHEFFLQAHQGLQGTARPAHYVVIKDDIGFDANSLEQITHHLCYLFGRAPKAVSYVPPAYYADILATRGRAYLYTTLQENRVADSTAGSSSSDEEWNGEIHPRLKDSMFYL